MEASKLKPGDLVQVDRKGVVFTAVLGERAGEIWTLAQTPSWVTYASATSRQVVKRLERQVRLGEAAG